MTKKTAIVKTSLCTNAVKAHCSCYKGYVMYMGTKHVCCFCGKSRRVVKRKKK